MKNSRKKEGLRIRPASAGDIVVLGGTIVVAAIGAAFVARRAGSGGDGKGRGRSKDVDGRGLRSLLDPGKGEASRDNLMETKGKERLPTEFQGEGESERGEDGSGESSVGSSEEAVWPAEAIEQAKGTSTSDASEMKHQQGEGDERLGMGIRSIFPCKTDIDHRDEEFAFGSPVEIQETRSKETVEKPAENSDNVVVNDFTFWGDKLNTPQRQTDRCTRESDIAHVTENALFTMEDDEKIDVSERDEIKQQLENRGKTGDAFSFEGNNSVALQNRVSSYCIEQQNGQDSVDSSEGTKEEEDVHVKSQEAMESHEDVGARGEGSEGSTNSSGESNDQSACLEDIVELEKVDNSIATNEITDQLDIPRNVEDVDVSTKGCNNIPVQESSFNAVELNMLNKETHENLEDLKITPKEADLMEAAADQNILMEVVENEEEERGDGIIHLNVKAKGGDDITNIEVEVVGKDENGEIFAEEVEIEAGGDDIIDEEQEQKGGDDIPHTIVADEVQGGGDDIVHIDVEVVKEEVEDGEGEKEENGGGIEFLDVKGVEVDEAKEESTGDANTHREVAEEVKEDQKGGDDIAHTGSEEGDQEKEENEAEGIAFVDFKGVEVDEAKEESTGDANTQREVAEEVKEDQRGGDDIAHTGSEEGDQEKEENEADGIAFVDFKGVEVDEAKEESVGDVNTHGEGGEEVKEEQKGGDDIAHTESEEGEGEREENEGEGIAFVDFKGVEVDEVKKGSAGDANNHGEIGEEVKEEQKGGDDIAHTESEEGEGEKEENEGEDIAFVDVKGVEVDEAKEESAGDANTHREVVEEVKEEQKGGDGIAHTESEEGEGEKEENEGEGIAVVDVKGVQVDEAKEESAGDANTQGEVVEEVKEEQKGRDGIAHTESEEGEGEKEENEGEGIAVVDVKGVQVDEAKEESAGDANTQGEVVEEVKEEQKGRDGIAHTESEEGEGEKEENEGEGIVFVDVKGVQVDEAKEESAGDANTHREVVEEVKEEQKGGDDIAHKESEEGEGEKEENEREGIAFLDVKGVKVDEAKVESAGDANTHGEVGEEVKEQKGEDGIAHTESEELIEKAVEEDEKGDCMAHMEMEEETDKGGGFDRTHEESEVVIVEVTEDEKEGDGIACTEAEVVKEEGNGGDDEQEGSSNKLPDEEIKSHVEEESEIQESIGTENPSMEFQCEGCWPDEAAESEKILEPTCEMKENLETPEKIIQVVDVAHAEGDGNTTGGIRSFLPSNDKNAEVSVGISVAVQEKDRIDLGVETASQNTCKKFDMALETAESMSVATIDHGDNIMKECSYRDGICNISQGEDKHDLQELDISEVVEEEREEESSMEAEIESCVETNEESATDESEETRICSMKTSAETIWQTKNTEEDKGIPFTENEMKLQSETTKKTPDVISVEQYEQDNHDNEQRAPKKEFKEIVTVKKKKMDHVLTGHSKGLFLLVLALALAIGLLAFVHHDHLHNYNHRLPKIYRQLYQFLFPPHNGVLGDL